MEGFGGFCSPRLLAVKTHKHSQNQGQERGAKNQIRRFLFFLFWVLKKRKKEKKSLIQKTKATFQEITTICTSWESPK